MPDPIPVVHALPPTVGCPSCHRLYQELREALKRIRELEEEKAIRLANRSGKLFQKRPK